MSKLFLTIVRELGFHQGHGASHLPLTASLWYFDRIMKNKILLLAVLLIGVVSVAAQEGESVGVKGGACWSKDGRQDRRERGDCRSYSEQRKVRQEGKALHVTTGPAVTYWNSKNTAKGDYTVSATFTNRST
jgi:hypothetical protein